jgi:hypothetical protein
MYGMFKHYEITSVHPYFSRSFQQYQEHNKSSTGLADLNMTKQRNKQPDIK